MNLLHFDWSIIFFAFLLDLVLGDPRRFPHPVIFIGRLISFLENLFRKLVKGNAAELAAGVGMAVIVPTVAFFVVYRLIQFANGLNARLGWFLAVFLGYTTIAVRSLYTESQEVAKCLSAGDIQGARKGLSYLVGRDTRDLDDKGIIRALVETVAENASDGVITPLFYLAVGGPPLAMAYKAVNTLDSMVGYKNERYLYFGRASARLDDIVNYLPARLTALLMVSAAFVMGRDWKSAWRIIVRDGGNHPSPNSGFPEAAVAGALGVRLGGLSYYGGVPSNKPSIGDEKRGFVLEDVKNAGLLMFAASIIMVSISVFILAEMG